MKSFIFPCFSISFYISALEKKLPEVIAFFLIFSFVITLVPTFQFATGMTEFLTEIQTIFEQENFPTVTIRDGIAEVSGSQPLVIENESTIVIVDTTGGTTKIDTQSHSEGFLLTRTELHIANEDGYQVIPLSDINNNYGNPIVIDKSSVTNLYATLVTLVTIFVFIGFYFWNSVVRLVYISIIGLIFWGVVSLSKKGTSFKPVLITGILANVPVIYLKFALGLFEISFFTLYTLLLVVSWAAVLWVFLRKQNSTEK